MLASQRHLFDIPDDVAYLNCAYMSPLPRSVVRAGEDGLRRKARPWGIGVADFFDDGERQRRLFAGLIGCTADDVALIPAASYGIATAAANLPVEKGDNVIVLGDQFPSNMYSWREVTRESGAELRVVPPPEGGRWTEAVLAAIDSRTAVASIPQCHWTDGSLVDLVAVSGALREAGAALVLDLSQSLGALPFDIAAVRPDFLTCATYKWLLGPYSCGFLYVAPRHHGGRPLEHNWISRIDSEDFAGLVRYRDEFQPGARRFDVGERSNFALAPAVVAGLECLQRWGVEKIQTTLQERTAEIARRAAERFNLRSIPTERRAGHYLGLRFPQGMPENFLARMAGRKVFLSQRGDSIRVTPHVYNTDRDIEQFFTALEEVLKEDRRGTLPAPQ